jgi:hypothetical protein
VRRKRLVSAYSQGDIVKDRHKARREATLRSRVARLRLLALVVVVVGVSAAAPAAAAFTYTAGAAEVVNDGGSADPTLSFAARGTEQNDVSITLSGDNYEVADTNPVTAGTGCVQADPMKASCAAAGIADIRVQLRAGDDRVVIRAPVKAAVFGGPGADSIDARGGVADAIACGDGEDPVTLVDAVDFVFTNCEEIDDGVPPDTTIDPASGPPAATTDTTARFSFSASESNSTFECSIDRGDFAPCTPSTTYTDLAEGPHSFQVRAIDRAGNGLADPTPAERTWSVEASAPPPPPVTGASAPTSVAKAPTAPARPPESLVLIAGRAIKVTRSRLVSVALNCSGTRACAGRVILATAKPVRYARKRKRIVRLASHGFQIEAGRTKKVKVRISRRKMRLLRKLRRVQVDVTVRDRDRAGRARVGTRTIVLRVAR